MTESQKLGLKAEDRGRPRFADYSKEKEIGGGRESVWVYEYDCLETKKGLAAKPVPFKHTNNSVEKCARSEAEIGQMVGNDVSKATALLPVKLLTVFAAPASFCRKGY